MKILVHICCGPCACYPIQIMEEENHSLTCFFFNPNIHPYKEFKERLLSAEKLCLEKNIPFIKDTNYYLREFLTKSLNIEKNTDGLNLDKRRCKMCYAWRFMETAKYAKENNFDAFTTTLLVSPYQDHEEIINICQRISKHIDIPFYYKDFRIGFLDGKNIAKEKELYMQTYCGCIFSEEERYSNAFKKRRKKKLKSMNKLQS